MDWIHKKIIQQSTVYLCQNLVVKDIYPHLFQEGVLSTDDEDTIEHEVKSSEKVRKFLRILESKSPTAYEKFLFALDETQPFIKEELEKKEKELRREERALSASNSDEVTSKLTLARPTQPIRQNSSSDSVTISWSYAGAVDYFEVKYRILGTKIWCTEAIKPEPSDYDNYIATITSLQANSVYEFQVRSYCQDEDGPLSTISDSISTQFPKLEKPMEHTVSDTKITIKWFPLSEFEKDIEKYGIKVKSEEENSWRKCEIETGKEVDVYIYDNMHANTNYLFQVYAIPKRSGDTILSDTLSVRTLLPQPNKPFSVKIKSNSITLKTNIPLDFQYMKNIIVEYKQLKDLELEGTWQKRNCNFSLNTFTVFDLKGDTEYLFRVKIVHEGYNSDFSDISDPITTKRDYPTQPERICITSHSISVRWDGPQGMDQSISYYEVHYRPKDVTNWEIKKTDDSAENIQIDNLQSSTSYYFRVRAIMGTKSGLFSPETDAIVTQQSLACDIKDQSRPLSDMHKTPNTMNTYKVPLKVTEKDGYREITLGVKVRNEVISDSKTLLLVGSTGTGKSLAVDTCCNYMFDVDFTDDFRIAVVDETSPKRDQSVSQTDLISIYQIPHFENGRIPCRINIVDTPGFADTRGPEAEAKLVNDIESLFKNRKDMTINAICFVIQASQCRLTEAQNKLFESIFSIFGKNLKPILHCFITFSDNFKPPVYDALYNIPNVPELQSVHKFNNGGLFLKHNDADKKAWDMSMNSFSLFFSQFEATTGVSLSLSAEVCLLRKQLNATVQGLKPQIQSGLNNLETLRQQIKAIEKHASEVKKSKDFKFKVDLTCKEKVKSEKWATNCTKCEVTCHCPCLKTPDILNPLCSVMTNSSCTVCEGKCPSVHHEMSGYKYVSFVVKKEQSLGELVSIYEKQITGENADVKLKVINVLKNKLEDILFDIGIKIQTIRQCFNQLNEKALMQFSCTQVGFIRMILDEDNCIDISKKALIAVLKTFAADDLQGPSKSWHCTADTLLDSWKKEKKILKAKKTQID